MNTILVATDGSTHADLAVNLAADLAEKYESDLILLYVVDDRALSDAERRLVATEFSELVEARASEVPDMRSIGAERYLSHQSDVTRTVRTTLGEGILGAYARDLAARGFDKVRTVLENGDPADTILDVAGKLHADLIVIGSRGQSDARALFLGSVSHTVANLASMSVFTVK